MSRWVRVDDTDSGINYSDGWTTSNGQGYAHQGNFGRVYRSSLHSTTRSSSFSYTYNGGRGRIYGTTDIRNTSGVIDPIWTCSLDGTPFAPNEPFRYTENNWPLCEWDADVGQHTITLTAQSAGRGFHFDYLDYVPAGNADVAGADVVYRWMDTAVVFGADGWQPLGDIGQMAVSSGAVITFNFYGTAVSWYGTTPRELPGAPSSATYRIDDEPERTFTVPGDHGGTTQYNTLILKTHDVPLGHHTLRVVSGGTTQQTPLVLGSYIVENGAVQPPPRSDSPSSGGGGGTSGNGGTNPGGGNGLGSGGSGGNSTSTDSSGRPVQTGGGSGGQPSDSSSPSNDNRTASDASTVGATSGLGPGAIAGIVVAFVGLVVLGVLLFLCYRRRQRRALRRLTSMPGGSGGSGGPASSPLGDSAVHMVPFSDSPPSLRGRARVLDPYSSQPPVTAVTIPSFYPNPNPAPTVIDRAASPDTSTNMYYSSDTQSMLSHSTTSGLGSTVNGQPVTFQPFNPPPAKFDPRPPAPVARYDNPLLEDQPPHYSPA